jgi:hypothetical protein
MKMGTTHSPWLAGRATAAAPPLRPDSDARQLRLNILPTHSGLVRRAVPRGFNAPQEARVMFETVVEPVLFRLKPDKP